MNGLDIHEGRIAPGTALHGKPAKSINVLRDVDETPLRTTSRAEAAGGSVADDVARKTQALEDMEAAARSALDRGDHDSAENHAKRLLARAKRERSSRHVAIATLLLGEVTDRRGDLELALLSFEDADRMSEHLRISDRIEVATCIGRTLRRSGQIAESVAFLSAAELRFSGDLDANPASASRLFVQMMAALYEIGSPEEAFRKIETAVKLAKRSRNRLAMADALWAHGVMLHDIEPKRALSLYRRAAAIYEGLGSNWNLHGVLNQVGSCAMALGNYTLARTALERAYDVAETGGPLRRAHVAQFLSRLELATGNVSKAVQFAEESVALYEGRQPHGCADSRVALGQALVTIDPPRAEKEMLRGIAELEALGAARDSAIALKALANLYESQGRGEDAAAALKRGLAADTVA